MPIKYHVEYTVPGTMGKIQKKSFTSSKARSEFIDKIKAKGGRIKATSSHD